MNVLQAMVDVSKYVLINPVHISAAVIKDTFQVGKGAKVHCTYPLSKLDSRGNDVSVTSFSPTLNINSSVSLEAIGIFMFACNGALGEHLVVFLFFPFTLQSACHFLLYYYSFLITNERRKWRSMT